MDNDTTTTISDSDYDVGSANNKEDQVDTNNIRFTERSKWKDRSLKIPKKIAKIPQQKTFHTRKF